MPIYEYHCRDCGHRCEVACHLEERKKRAVCPECESKQVEQLFSSFSCEPPKRW